MSAMKTDPAPSRLAYKLQRWWLTPMVRATLRTGVPAFVLAFSVGFFLADKRTVEAFSLSVLEIRRSIEERPEFMVHAMRVEGASDELAHDIGEAMGVDFPVSSFDLDLAALLELVSDLDAVAQAELTIRPGGILEVTLKERTAALVWQGPRAIEALDATGHRVVALNSRDERPTLPLVVGAGANSAAAEALALMAAAAPIAEHVLGLVRLGERRWDVVLEGGQRIQLPAQGAVEALDRVLAAHAARGLLQRDILLVDMRNPQRPTLRLSPEAVDAVAAARVLAAFERDKRKNDG